MEADAVEVEAAVEEEIAVEVEAEEEEATVVEVEAEEMEAEEMEAEEMVAVADIIVLVAAVVEEEEEAVVEVITVVVGQIVPTCLWNMAVFAVSKTSLDSFIVPIDPRKSFFITRRLPTFIQRT